LIGGGLGALFGYLDPPETVTLDGVTWTKTGPTEWVSESGNVWNSSKVTDLSVAAVRNGLSPETASGLAGGFLAAARSALDYASYVPGPIGAIASVGGAAFAVANGEYIAAGLALAGVIPGAKLGLRAWNMSHALSKFPNQVRASGAVHTLVSPNRLVVSESHLSDLTKAFSTYNGKVNALSTDYWKHVMPHRHVYDLPTAPSALNANWRKTFEKAGASKQTIWAWEELPK
jgi:hypothetical protein